MNDSLKPWQQNLKAAQARWQALAPRERQMLTVAGWLALLTLLVMVGVRPALRTLAAMPEQQREVQRVLDDMNRQADEVRVLRQQPPLSAEQSEAALRAATDRLGEAARLTVQTDRVVVNLSKVEGRLLAQWLTEVRASARARVLEANLAQSETARFTGNVVLALSSGGR